MTTALVKRLAVLRQGWAVFVAGFTLLLIRRWLLSKGLGDQPNRRPRKNQGPPAAGRSHSSRSNSDRRVGGKDPGATKGLHHPYDSPPCRPASEQEIGPTWHFGGRRRWLWLHDGKVVNGWIEFGEAVFLRTSLARGGTGAWEQRPTGEMVCTFGRCHHVIELLPASDGPPSFKMRQRMMKDGSPLRDKGPPRTRGRLDLDAA